MNSICIFNKNSKSYSPLIVLTFCLSPVRWASSTISFPNCEKQLTKSVNVVTEYSSFRVFDTYSKELKTNLEIIHIVLESQSHLFKFHISKVIVLVKNIISTSTCTLFLNLRNIYIMTYLIHTNWLNVEYKCKLPG